MPTPLRNLNQLRFLAVLTAFLSNQREGELRTHYGKVGT
jgi:hypothetical protein